MSAQNIQVAVRCRPLSDREKKSNSYCVIECNERRREVVAIDRNSSISSTKTFTFDKVFGMESKQIDVYNQVVRPVVKEVLEGYNCTIFAYGQTGTGKTFTMEGDYSQLNDSTWEDDPNVGIIPRSVSHLFTLLSSMPHCEYSVKISYMELYNEELTDLLGDSSLEKEEKLKIYDDPGRKGSVIVSKLEEVNVQNKNQVFKILQKGADRRQKASTLMNNQSSRSHSIFTITVFIKDRAIEGEEIIKVGKLNLVDLAGSENIERSGATGKRAAEAGKINKSLTTLGRVITALVQHSDHIPYRESNLTRLLQDSLGGRTKTTIIATVSPALCNLEETLSTLDYAHKAKSIRNKPEINQKLVKKQLIKEYNEEIERLKRELNATREKNGVYLPAEIYQEMESNTKMLKLELREYIKKFSANSEQLDCKTEELKKLQEELEEKNENLYQTQTALSKTNGRVDSLEQQIKELRFLVAERKASEEKLSSQAKKLVQCNSELEADNVQLFCKIDRFKDLESKNGALVNNFTHFVYQNVSTLNEKEHEILVASKQKNCSLCELLKEIQLLSHEKNDQEQQHLDWMDKKSKAWTESQLYFVEKELENIFKENFGNLQKTIDTQHSNFGQTCDNVVGFCQEHKESFLKTCCKLNGSIETLSQDWASFESNFFKMINNFLADQIRETNESSSKIISGLAGLNEANESNKSHIGELFDFKQSLKNEINESMNSIQDLISKVSQRLNSKLDKFGSQCEQLSRNSEHSTKNYNNLVDLIKENEQKRNKKFSSELDSQINAPIKTLIENNSKKFIEAILILIFIHY
ncbi:kinesin KIF11 [Brachionus plicatilis]|uniref:Kinesin-like protein n=1 Tax=Brachionus plicatilis TaxID=10195 RepID=A0A3M7SVT3_BRAPC|nr:kinesin KIF11 [Brachionus plicatilis]